MILWKSNADCHEHCPSLEPYSPASKVSQYVPTVFSSGDTRHHTGYQGWPDDEKDALWMDLYRYGISLAVSSSDYDKMIDTTEKMPVRGFEQDYVVGLDVFHQLHCLNMIRMGFYPGRYNTSLLKPDGTINYLQWVHVDHCIESIRQSVMCHADIATFTYRWSDKDKIMKPELGSTHICRNFTIVREYAMERNVDWQNIRAHVEDGEVVDYTNSGPHPYDDPHLEEAPEGWKYRREDLL
ncbi:hypothetical protein QBC47DRAFT_413247 [Echria macrotheca]|uniref:Tat pathway signal sequence n=1 Tax=Echria macrotheca TaxID=438768 RepID=A0AAJ0BBZ3_9PEZI|nr:hypothetical protein QBC47DRAFT_413247 [Echria macrotheca]